MLTGILIQIYTPLYTNGSIFRNVPGHSFLVKIYWSDRLAMFSLMVLETIVTKALILQISSKHRKCFGIHGLGINKTACRWLLISFG